MSVYIKWKIQDLAPFLKKYKNDQVFIKNYIVFYFNFLEPKTETRRLVTGIINKWTMIIQGISTNYFDLQ